jgi:hypothetical protein
MNSSLKGVIAESAVIHEATKLGLPVMRPSIEGLRYDLVIDNHTRLLRVQCKWGRRRGHVVAIRTSTSRLTPAGYVRTTYTADEIEGFAVYCPDNERCYWLPIRDFAGQSYVHLRLTPARNNQAQSIRWAADYPFGAVAQLGERSAGSRKVRGSSPLSSIA